MIITFSFDGFVELFAKLDKLKKAKAKAIWKKAVRAGSARLLQIARPMVVRKTGALRKSLAVRIKARRGDGRITGIVGPRTKFEKTVKGIKRKPSRYAHLVEKVKPFMSKAVVIGRASVYKAMAAKVTEELEKI